MNLKLSFFVVKENLFNIKYENQVSPYITQRRVKIKKTIFISFLIQFNSDEQLFAKQKHKRKEHKTMTEHKL